MSISYKQIKLLRAGVSFLGMSEDDYRAMLKEVAGVKSAKKLNGVTFELVMKHLHRCGFPDERKYTAKVGMATPAQQREIDRLWALVSRAPEEHREKALRGFLERLVKVSARQFLTYSKAQKVLIALNKMKQQKEGSCTETNKPQS